MSQVEMAGGGGGTIWAPRGRGRGTFGKELLRSIGPMAFGGARGQGGKRIGGHSPNLRMPDPCYVRRQW